MHSVRRNTLDTGLNILAPINVARNAEVQVRYAVDVAKSLRTNVTLLYVIDPLHSRPPRAGKWPLSAIAAPPDREVRRVAVRGPVVETIAEYAGETNTGVVVLTSGQLRTLGTAVVEIHCCRHRCLHASSGAGRKEQQSQAMGAIPSNCLRRVAGRER